MIAKWKLKAVVQKALSFLPAPERANHWFQKNITKGVRLTDEHLGYKIRHARDHIRYFNKYSAAGGDKILLELGTGWYPIVPVMTYLTRTAGRTLSVDIHDWMTRESFCIAIRRIGEWKESGRLKEAFGEIDEERWTDLTRLVCKEADHSLEEMKKYIGLNTRLQDARELDLPDRSVDMICSNNTFEHIYPDVLRDILKTFKRVIRTGGVMSHFIDMSDHFAHFDQSINIYHFLRYSQRVWHLIDNSIQPQSRLRFRDYLEMYEALRIPVTETEIWPYDPGLLREQPVHEELKRFTEEELAVTHGYIVSRF